MAIHADGPEMSLWRAPTQALLQGADIESEQQSAADSASANDASASVELREGFRVGPIHMAIRYADGSELAELPHLHRLPNAPAWFPGMANLNGSLVPVFDLAPLLHVTHAADAKPMLLVLGHGNDKSGLHVDGIPQRVRFAAIDRLAHFIEPPALADCIETAIRVDGVDWLGLRAHALLERLASLLAH